jgi:predicted anti-sigma-YlaC factor YlaD
MASTEITCHELVELVTDYLEGAMPQAERDRLELHLGACTDCLRYLNQMKHTIRTVGQLQPESVSPKAQEELLQVFRAWKQR